MRVLVVRGGRSSKRVRRERDRDRDRDRESGRVGG